MGELWDYQSIRKAEFDAQDVEHQRAKNRAKLAKHRKHGRRR